MITTDDVYEFTKALDEKRYYDAHEILEEKWFENRFKNSNEVKLLKGFINGCVSFELHNRGRFLASKKAWKTYLKYRQLLFKTGSTKIKLYYDIFLQIEKTKKGLSLKKGILGSLLISTFALNASAELITYTELGYTNSSGNTNNEVFTTDVKIKKELDTQIFTILLQGKYSQEDEVETANNWLAELQYDYKFSKLFSLNYLYGHRSDKFSSYEYQIYTGPGIKYLAINDSKVHNLSFALSYLYSLDKTADQYVDINNNHILYPYVDGNGVDIVKAKTASGERLDYESARLSLEYRWKISENLKFTQDATYRQNLESSDKYFAYSKSTLSTKIAEYLSAGLSYRIDYTNEVQDDIERTDKTFTANLIIDY